MQDAIDAVSDQSNEDPDPIKSSPCTQAMDVCRYPSFYWAAYVAYAVSRL